MISPLLQQHGCECKRLFSPIIRLYSRIHHVNIRDERSVGEQVRSGLRLAGWILLTFAVVGVTLLSEKTLLDRSAPNLHRTAGACGLILVAILMFVSVERWGKWFVGALGYWIVKSVFTLPFRPSVMLLQYLLLFIFAFALCARWALRHAPRPTVEKVGMLVVVLALTVSLTLDSPLPLLVGVGVMALTQLAAYVFRPTHRHAKLGET